MIKYDNQNKCGIKIEQIPLDTIKEMDYTPEAEDICTLFWAEDYNNIQLLFFSNTKKIQAFEFMDYLIHNYARIQGNAQSAKSTLPHSFFQVMLSDFEATDATELFEKIIEHYFSECDCIYSKEFSKQLESNISEIPQYVKKKIPWAYVKTTDIMKSGTKFYLKSIENQSKLLLETSDDIYIMIGCRGEVYHITREKFEKTYEASEEQLDIFEQMISYLPEIEDYETGEFITLDEIAHLCFPKTSKGIYVLPLKTRTKIFNPYNKGEYFLGQKGDYMAIRHDDLSDIYIIQKYIFYETYEEVKNISSSNTKIKVSDFTIYNANNNIISLSHFIGKPIIMRFWATWSNECKKELENFQRIYKELGNDIHFVMINMTDSSDETVAFVKSYVEDQGFTFPVYFDIEMNATITYNINKLPTTYFIDKEGYLIEKIVGEIDNTTLETKINMLLN